MITSITREFDLSPNIVGINTTDNLSTITSAGYFFGTQGATIEQLTNGVWKWDPGDLILMFYAVNLLGLFTYDSGTDAFVSLAPNGGLSNTLPSGEIFVGNASNVATPEPMTGAVTISNAGVTSISNGAVDFPQLANDVLQTATISLTSAQIQGMYATPVLLLPAPGAGKLIVISSLLIDVTYGTTNYTAGGNIFAQYDNSAFGMGPPASSTISGVTFDNVAANNILSTGPAIINVNNILSVNRRIFLTNINSAFATGDSTATVYLRYYIQSVV